MEIFILRKGGWGVWLVLKYVEEGRNRFRNGGAIPLTNYVSSQGLLLVSLGL